MAVITDCWKGNRLESQTSVVYPPTGSRPTEGRSAPCLHFSMWRDTIAAALPLWTKVSLLGREVAMVGPSNTVTCDHTSHITRFSSRTDRQTNNAVPTGCSRRQITGRRHSLIDDLTVSKWPSNVVRIERWNLRHIKDPIRTHTTRCPTELFPVLTSPQSNLRRARRKCPIGYIGTP